MIMALAPVFVVILAVSVAPAAELAPPPANTVFTVPVTTASPEIVPAADTLRPTSPAAVGPAAVGPDAGATASVQVSVTVQAARLIVLDRADRVVEIWSNTTAAPTSYQLYAARGSEDGPRVATIPATALAEYEALLQTIDWSVVGLAYQAH